MNDDPKKPETEQFFDTIFKNMGKTPPGFDPPDPGPEKTLRRPSWRPGLDPMFPFDVPIMPIPKAPMSPEEQMRELALLLQSTMPPPEPYGKYDSILYDITAARGYRPTFDFKFGLDPKNRFLFIDAKASYAIRVLSIAHELGHEERIRSGHLSVSTMMQALMPLGVIDPKNARYVMREEIMAWKLGMKLLRKIGCRFSSTSAARELRRVCLATYRITVRTNPLAVKRLTVKE